MIYKNENPDIEYILRVELELHNFTIAGKEPNDTEIIIEMKPGESKFHMLKPIELTSSSTGASLGGKFSYKSIGVKSFPCI